MAPKLRPRKHVNGKGTSRGVPVVADLSSSDVKTQGAPQETTSFLPRATVSVDTGSVFPPPGFPVNSLSSPTLNHPSSHTLSHETPPAQTRPPRGQSLPGHPAPSASSEVRLKPSSSAVDVAKRRSECESVNNFVGHPPGYIHRPGPALRQSDSNRWPHGVLSGGALIRILEELSRSSQNGHRQVCIWLESFVARFGRIHNLDGSIVTNTQDMHMLMLAHGLWLGTKDVPAEGDVFWVAGLEPTENVDQDWEARAKHNLPELPQTYRQKRWTAGDAQYLYGTSIKRPRKGSIVCEKWVDGMHWEREIWQAWKKKSDLVEYSCPAIGILPKVELPNSITGRVI